MTEAKFCSYFKNFILCGEIDFHCMLCQESFFYLETVDKHLKWEKHRSLLKKQAYDERYKRDFLYKIRDDFYCEACNELTTEPKKHRQCSSHVAAKSVLKKPKFETMNYPITRCSDGTVFIGDVQVTALEWHGIKKDFCTVCSRQIQDVTIHNTLNIHVINLIQSNTVKCNEYYYRMLSHEKFYCFICLNVHDNSTMEDHMTEDCDVAEKYKNNYSNKAYRNMKVLVKTDPELHSALLIMSQEYYKINDKKGEAECRICNKAVKADIAVMIKHKDNHENEKDSDCGKPYDVKYSEVVDHGKRRHELVNYGKDNYIKFNTLVSWGYCSLCHTRVSASMRQVMSHVYGRRHKCFLELHGLWRPSKHEKTYWRKIKFTSFMISIFKINGSSYLVNDQIQIHYSSFMLLGNYGIDTDQYICFGCNEVIEKSDAQNHCKTKTHVDKMLACHVMTDYDEKSEFIRLIRPNVYHCAVCDLILPYWDNLRGHISGLSHGARRRVSLLPCNEANILRSMHGPTLNRNNSVNIHLKRLGLI
ncbi:unnamed protein product [Pieris macdunnoughi]|uniref:C2H2-type domain-containing protein n=1 Tax=Pieris macdunnoughi TaxID=345717 RepID=A0A821RGT5_9NEOP|nr:unnamed protein product [Pieris macdunnoughi]